MYGQKNKSAAMSEKKTVSRNAQIFRTGMIAILVNVALGIFKAGVGFITNSVAITLDAVNNFTDAGSSLITIFAAAFSGRPADKKHPFGYGRIEYLGTLIIGALIFYAGINALLESMDRILHPETAEYSWIVLGIIVIAVIIKVVLAFYVMKTGKRVNSESLIASGKEAIADISVSISTVAAALLCMVLGISIEAYLGVIIAIVIIRSGLKTLIATIGRILGTPGDAELVREIKKRIAKHEGVVGAYDLIFHDYGQETHLASVHVAVTDTMPIHEFDRLTRELQTEIMEAFGVRLTAVGVYSVNDSDPAASKMQREILKMVMTEPSVHQMHGFYLNQDKKEIRFDLVVGFDTTDRQKSFDGICRKVRESYPDYHFEISMDVDFNEL